MSHVLVKFFRLKRVEKLLDLFRILPDRGRRFANVVTFISASLGPPAALVARQPRPVDYVVRAFAVENF